MTQDNNTPATSYIPMLYDKTVYAIYLIIKGSKYNHAELKAFSKICNINYLEANQKLKHKKNFKVYFFYLFDWFEVFETN